MKNSEIKGLSLDELKNRLGAEYDAYQKLKFAHAITPIENPTRIKVTRKLIARLNTEIRAKEIAQ